jgi:hypothetical protein
MEQRIEQRVEGAQAIDVAHAVPEPTERTR